MTQDVPLQIWIYGLKGRMGQALQTQLQREEYVHPFLLAGGSHRTSPGAFETTPWHVCVDVSSPEGTKELFQRLAQSGLTQKSLLIATTGVTPEDKALCLKMVQGKGHGILWAPNTSLGIGVLVGVLVGVAKSLVDQGFDVDISETHHRHKKDAPSGTALMLAHLVQAHLVQTSFVSSASVPTSPRPQGQVHVHVERRGGVCGEHRVSFTAEDEEVTFTHRAFGRSVYAKGALHLAQLIHKKTWQGAGGSHDLPEFLGGALGSNCSLLHFQPIAPATTRNF